MLTGLGNGRLQSEHLIKKLSHFAQLSLQEENMLVRVGSQRARNLPAHSNIIEENEKPNVFYLVQKGWTLGYKLLQNGRRQITSFFLPGDICYPNLFVLKQMDHSIGTITAVRISEISRRNIEELAANYPRLIQALWWEFLVSSAIQREWTVNIAHRGALERVAHLICELFLRLESVGLTNGDTCEFPLTQTDLGDALGLTGIHVNRTLQRLRSLDLLVLRDRELTIPDFRALQRVAMFNPNYLHLSPEGRRPERERSARTLPEPDAAGAAVAPVYDGSRKP